MAGTIRIVFNRFDRTDGPVLVPLEVDAPIDFPGTATAMACRDAAMMVSPAVPYQPLAQRLFGSLALVGQLRKVVHVRSPPPGRRWFVLFHTHQSVGLDIHPRSPRQP